MLDHKCKYLKRDVVLEAPGGYSLYSCELNKMDKDDCLRCEKSNIPRTNISTMRERLEMDGF
jgi:hypothetical protein